MERPILSKDDTLERVDDIVSIIPGDIGVGQADRKSRGGLQAGGVVRHPDGQFVILVHILRQRETTGEYSG